MGKIAGPFRNHFVEIATKKGFFKFIFPIENGRIFVFFFPLVCAGNRSQQQLALTERVIILLIEKSD